MVTSLYVMIGINIILLFFQIFRIIMQTKKKTIALIVNQNEETEKTINFNPSTKKFNYGKESYVLGKQPFLKYKNMRFVIYEKGNPEPLPILKDQDDRRINADTFYELLQMEKIKALNKGESFFGSINKNYVFIGLAVVILLVILLGGFF